MNQFVTLFRIAFASSALIAISSESSAQEIVYDDFTMNPGYENMVYYSVDNGVAGTANMASWDLAFDVRPVGATALINSGQGMSLFPAGPLSDWDVIDETFPDNSGAIVPFQNGTAYWSQGAFSEGGDGSFDLGWGVYDIVTHTIASDKMYVISLPDGTWKKFALLSLVSDVYSFQCANLDGTDFFEDQVAKSNYLGKIHAFYNLTNQEELDLEPASGWDMLFIRYVEEIQPGVNYGVTGALTHPSVRVQEENGLADPFVDGAIDVSAMTDSINAIGYDWKSFGGGSFYVLDDRCYFVESVTGSQWRLVFTGFDGSSTGNVELGKLSIVAYGCTDENACNFNSAVVEDDGSCDYSCLGCTDSDAQNWNQDATLDDGSCSYFQPSCQFVGALDWLDLSAGIYTEVEILIHEFGVEDSGTMVLNLPEVAEEPLTGNPFVVVAWNDLTVSGLPSGFGISNLPNDMQPGSQVCLAYGGTPIEEGTFDIVVSGDLTLSVFGQPFPVGSYASTVPMLIEPNVSGIVGCMYPNATNYMSYATIESGTCSFEGCMDPEANNFQIFATSDDGSCLFEPCESSCLGDLNSDGAVGTPDLLTLLSTFGIECN